MKIKSIIFVLLSFFLLGYSGISNSDNGTKNKRGTFFSEDKWDHSAAKKRHSQGKMGYSGGFIDVNGDGSEDLIIGAPDAGASFRKRAASGLLITSKKGSALAFLDLSDGFQYSWKKTGENFGDNMGYSFANLGDVDGDGKSDFAVSAVFAEGETSLSGSVYVYRGGHSSPLLLAKLTGSNAFDVFGYSITGGDINGDGVNDIIVSARQATGQYFQSGILYIYLGGPYISNTPDIIINESPAVLASHGQPALGACLTTGDVNGDGISDLLAGDTYSVFIYFGKTDIVDHLNSDMTPDVEIKAANCRPKESLAFLGDISGDGIGDIAIGYSRSSTHKGNVYIVKGSDNLPDILDPSVASDSDFFIKISGGAATDKFGYSVAAAGDINGGGFPDLLVSAIWAEGDEGSNTPVGKVYLFYAEDLPGGADYDVSDAARTYTANIPFSEFGKTLSAGSNGTFFVGAPLADNYRGTAFVFDIITGSSTEIGTN
ncbi:MAG: integrin alpha [Nitrospirota bacterium]